jgi:S1-C subfamily serine protease
MVSLPGAATLPPPEPATSSAADGASPADTSAAPESGNGIWIDRLGLQFVPTSSGAMVLQVKPGSIAAAKGIEGGDFIESVDGVAIKALGGDQMAAKIGAPTARTLHMIAAGDVRIR